MCIHGNFINIIFLVYKQIIFEKLCEIALSKHTYFRKKNHPEQSATAQKIPKATEHCDIDIRFSHIYFESNSTY